MIEHFGQIGTNQLRLDRKWGPINHGYKDTFQLQGHEAAFDQDEQEQTLNPPHGYSNDPLIPPTAHQTGRFDYIFLFCLFVCNILCLFNFRTSSYRGTTRLPSQLQLWLPHEEMVALNISGLKLWNYAWFQGSRIIHSCSLSFTSHN